MTNDEELEEQMRLSGVERTYQEKDKAPIVEFIKKYIKLNGYVNTRYASGMTVPGKKFTNNDHRDAFYESISAMLVNTGKYTRELNKDIDKGYNILLNPSYFYNKSVKLNSRITILIAAIAALVSILNYTKGINAHKELERRQQQINLEWKSSILKKEIQQIVLQTIDSLNKVNK